MPDFYVIVVGLGAMGSAAAYHLARRGQRVLGIEAFARGHELGSSHGETRIIRMAYYEHPDYVPLLRRAYELWSDLEHDAGVQLLTISGGLMLGRPDSGVVAGSLASARQHALEHSVLSAAGGRGRYPPLQPGAAGVALWEPSAGYLRPERCIDAHVGLAARASATLRYEEPVRGWRASDREVEVRTNAGTYSARHAVFTCGARMSGVLGDAIPAIRAERIPLFWLQPERPELFAAGRLPIYLWETASDAHIYGFPHVGWPGVKVARHHSRDYGDADAVERTVGAEDERRLRAAIERKLPALNGPVVASKVCLYEDSADEHFLIDRLAEHPNVVYAGGFSGHGFKFASVVGEILADLVTRGEATPHAAFPRASRLGVGGTRD